MDKTDKTRLKELDEKRVKAIAEKLKRLRIEAGYTSYEQFAVAKGFDRKQYWRHESGYNFTITTLFRIIDAHDITPAQFFSEWDKKF